MSKLKNNFLMFSIAVIFALFFGSLILKSHLYFLVGISIFILAAIALKSPLLFLILMVIIYEKGFQTIDFGIPHWMYVENIAVIFLVIGLIIQFIKGKFGDYFIKEDIYFRYVLLIFLIVFSSIFIGSWWILNQPIETLIFRTREFFLYLIFLYLTMANFNCGQIKRFIKFGAYSAIIISILVIIDAKLLGGGKIFHLAMSNGVSGVRTGAVRIFTYPFITIWAYFYLLSVIRFEKEIIRKVLYIIFILIISYQIIFCNMTRQIIVMLFLTTILYFFNLKFFSKIIITSTIGVIIILAGIIYANNSNLLKNSFFYKITQVTQYEATQTMEGNIAIRLNAIKYFYPYFKKTGFLGIGTMSFSYENSPVRIGAKKGYIFGDLGFFAILFRFGVFSVIFIIFVLKSIFKDLRFIEAEESYSEIKIIADSLIYLFISQIILLPTSTIFFGGHYILYYGIIFYFISRIKKDVVRKASNVINT